MSTERTERCDRCKWWERGTAGDLYAWEKYLVPDDDERPTDWEEGLWVGTCHCHPPVLSADLLLDEHRKTIGRERGEYSVSALGDRLTATMFPVTDEDDFCGEFTPKEEQEQ